MGLFLVDGRPTISGRRRSAARHGDRSVGPRIDIRWPLSHPDAQPAVLLIPGRPQAPLPHACLRTKSDQACANKAVRSASHLDELGPHHCSISGVEAPQQFLDTINDLLDFHFAVFNQRRKFLGRNRAILEGGEKALDLRHAGLYFGRDGMALMMLLVHHGGPAPACIRPALGDRDRRRNDRCRSWIECLMITCGAFAFARTSLTSSPRHRAGSRVAKPVRESLRGFLARRPFSQAGHFMSGAPWRGPDVRRGKAVRIDRSRSRRLSPTCLEPGSPGAGRRRRGASAFGKRRTRLSSPSWRNPWMKDSLSVDAD